jgi:UDP-N-acetylglucosamine 2-epimerase
MMKIMTVVGTRPEIIRLSEVIQKCDRYFNNILVHTGQNWEYTLNQIFFNEMGIRKPDYRLNCAGGHLGETIGNIIARTYELMLKEQPSALLILGDTNSTLCALGAKRLKIPIFHMEAGNRCFDLNVPEEINRKMIDHISDVNLAYTEHGRRYLIAEGFRKDHIIVTGSPLKEVLVKSADKINQSTVLTKLNLCSDQFFVVSVHREENVDGRNSLAEIADTINSVVEEFDLPLVFSTHPRTHRAIAENNVVFNDRVRIMEPVGFYDYNKLQSRAFCALSDSGTLSEESAILGFPAVLLRTSTERPEAVDKGTIVIAGLKKESVISAIRLARELLPTTKKDIPYDYRDDNVSDKVVKIILGYYDRVNRFIWHKD